MDCPPALTQGDRTGNLSTRTHAGRPAGRDPSVMSAPIQPRTTTAYHAQAVLSFALATAALAAGIACLPVDAWMRAFLAVALLYVITSAFTLAKVVRDRQDAFRQAPECARAPRSWRIAGPVAASVSHRDARPVHSNFNRVELPVRRVVRVEPEQVVVIEIVDEHR